MHNGNDYERLSAIAITAVKAVFCIFPYLRHIAFTKRAKPIFLCTLCCYTFFFAISDNTHTVFQLRVVARTRSFLSKKLLFRIALP